ncbi:hypothetical protein PASE110613_00745 [Paenibacillus sediminis]
MLRYSSYQSIYESNTTSTNIRSTNFRSNSDKRFGNLNNQAVVHSYKSIVHNRFLSSTVAKIFILTMILIVTCTGMVSAFAASDRTDSMPLDTIVVHSGDTLWGIAEKYKPAGSDTRIYIEGIKNKNDLNGSQIEVGDVLVLPRFK